MTLSAKLISKINWIAEKQVLKPNDCMYLLQIYFQHSLNYLSNPSISKDDKTIERKLRTNRSDFSVHGKLKLLHIYIFVIISFKVHMLWQEK